MLMAAVAAERQEQGRSKMKKTLRWLDVNFEAILMVLFFSLMILLVTVQVVLRFYL